MASVRYVELDQIATVADAVIDFSPPTPHTDYEYSFNANDSTAFAIATSSSNTDRYNLDIIDENCWECRNREYSPESTGRGVDVYILDTGIRYDHSEFGGRARYGNYDAIDESQNTNQRGHDCHGHGTHCSGIAAGRVSGVAKEANVYSVRVLDCNSFGGFSGIIRALDHVLRRHRERLHR